MADPVIQQEDLFNFLLDDARAPFSGWDFSHIVASGRMVEAPLTWSYTSILLEKIRNIHSLLDMHTGGGEYLSSLHPLPTHTSATEEYAPNVPIARQRLAPLGIKVYDTQGTSVLPFADNEFDLVINRHGHYSAQEVRRIVKPGGHFITQQVGGSNLSSMISLFSAPPYQYASWQLGYVLQELQNAGWQIVVQKEDHPITRFFDIGAIVYYLKAIPWQIADFTVEKYFSKLVEAHNRIQREGYLDFAAHRFLIVARKVD